MHRDVFVYRGSTREVKDDLSKMTSEEFESMKKEIAQMNDELREQSRISILNLFKRADQAIHEINHAPRPKLTVVAEPEQVVVAEEVGSNAEAAASIERLVLDVPSQVEKPAQKFGMAFFKEGFFTTTSLVVSSIKGGVGKSSAAVSIAGAYSEMFPDNNVLLIDCDPQGNASTALGCAEGDKGMYELFSSNIRLETVMRKTAIPNIHVIPADPRLMQYQMRLLMGYAGNPRINFVLKDRIDQFKKETKGNWFIIFDTRPDIGVYTLNAYIAADALLCPITPCEFALDGFSLVFDTVEFVNKYNPSLKVLGVFRSKWEKVNSINTKLAEEEIAKYGSLVFQTVVPNQSAIPNAIRDRVPVNYSKANKHSTVAKAYKALMQEVLDRWNRLERIAGAR